MDNTKVVTLDKLLDSLFLRGHILLEYRRDQPPSVTYATSAWLEIAAFFCALSFSKQDRYWFLNECILTHPSGEQMDEDEYTEFLVRCVQGRESLSDKLMEFIKRHVPQQFEQRFIDRASVRR